MIHSGGRDMEERKNSTPDIRKNLVLNAPIQKVWDAVATSEGIDSWFMPNDFKQELGYEFTLQSPFGPSPCRVEELEPPNLLVFSWDTSGWKITFELKEIGDKTEFTLTHSGWGAPDEILPGPSEPVSVIRDRMDNGWENIVNQALRKVVEQ
jgi:uncharacterized protein YndB with AHSA1/START domain